MAFDINKWAGRHLLEESAATLQKVSIREVGADGGGVNAGTGTKRQITIIEAGWGSSGYYPREVLERDGPKVWPAGTHMYMDHPSRQEEADQPERKVAQLAAVLTKDPFMSGDALVSECQLFDQWAPVVNEVADHIGVSIRAIGGYEQGEAEGRKGPIIQSLDEGISVDFVTHAGAKGKVGKLIESAISKGLQEARNVAEWLEAFIHATFTSRVDDGFGEGYITRDERLALSAAIGDALDAFHASVESNVPQLFDRDPFVTPEIAAVAVDEAWAGVFEEAMAKLGEPYGIRKQDGEFCVYNVDTGSNVDGGCHESRSDALSHQRAMMANVPDAREGKSRSGGGKEPDMGDEAKQLSEAQEQNRQHETRIAELEESAKEAKERVDRAEDALLLASAKAHVAKVIDEGQDGDTPLPELPERALERVVENATKGKLPLTEDGKLDKDRLGETVVKAVRDEAEYLGIVSETGKVKGLGETRKPGDGNGKVEEGEVSEEDKAKLIESFKAQGMSDEAAKIAAEGR